MLKERKVLRSVLEGIFIAQIDLILVGGRICLWKKLRWEDD
jgi:hypothetical protein